jgi:hypothetical protein
MLSLVASRGISCSLLFIFDLLYKRVSSLSCIGSATCGFIYKAGQKSVSREVTFYDLFQY